MHCNLSFTLTSTFCVFTQIATVKLNVVTNQHCVCKNKVYLLHMQYKQNEKMLVVM